MNKTKIGWADYTWNPVTGCTPISEGCTNCYAEAMAKRFNSRIEGDCSNPETRINPHPFNVRLHQIRLDQPLKIKKPSRIFVCSMGDLFHEDVPDDFIMKVLETMDKCKQHIFIILTKRPERMKNLFNELNHFYGYLTNLWLGVTAENQARADERIPILLQTPAAKRFVSIEPMLGPVNLTSLCEDHNWVINGLTGEIDCNVSGPNNTTKLDWVIIGGETGPRARECREEWIKSIYDKCKVANVPFFFKQAGKKWVPSCSCDCENECVDFACHANATLGIDQWK